MLPRSLCAILSRRSSSQRRVPVLGALSKLEADLAVTYVIYFGYMFVLSAGLFLLCGSVGFAASFWFVRQIYSAIKVD